MDINQLKILIIAVDNVTLAVTKGRPEKFRRELDQS